MPDVGKLMLCLSSEDKCAVFGLSSQDFKNLLESETARPSELRPLSQQQQMKEKGGINGASSV